MLAKLSPVVAWKIQKIHNKLVGLVKENSSQNVESAKWLLLVTYKYVER